jgi:hypothetical protein
MPQMITRQLLQAEGFTDIRFVDEPKFLANATEQLAHGDVDLMVHYASNFMVALDKGEATTLLAGVHVGCFVLFGTEDVHDIAGLKGKTVGVPGGFESGAYLLMSLMAAEVGLDPKKDLRWIADPKEKPKDLFIAGKVDAFLAFPPEPQELRARHIGRVIFDTTVDRPWSQYFYCMLAGNPEFVRRHPVATKRAMSAIMKATDVCASDPASAARLRLRVTDAERRPIRCMAGVRRRGRRAVLGSAHARGGLHQVNPAKDYRRTHRLALPRRAKTRAEGVNRARSYWSGYGWPLSTHCGRFPHDKGWTAVDPLRPIPARYRMDRRRPTAAARVAPWASGAVAL